MTAPTFAQRMARLQNDPTFQRFKTDDLKRFVYFHQDNTHVLKEFLRIAREMKTRGWKKSSAWAVIQIIRWDLSVHTDTTEDYKISNMFIGMYGRLTMMLYPSEFSGFFEIR